MSPIPWAAILMHGPALLSAAEKLFLTQSKGDKRHQTHETRLDQLEKASVESARLIQELAQQVQALTIAHEEASRKLRTVLAVSCIAFAVALLALLLALFR